MQQHERASLRAAIATGVYLASASVIPAPAVAAGNSYAVTFIVSDQAGAKHKDTRLKNAWGIAFLPDDFFWVNGNRTGLSLLYDGNGLSGGPAIRIPLPPPPRRPDLDPKFSAPTGIVSNTANDFFVDNDPAWPARFMFNTEDGTIAAWFEGEGSSSEIMIDNSLNGANCKPKPKATCQGAVYKGLALARSKTHGHLLYATNFRSGKVEVYNRLFKPVNLGASAFVDHRIPAGYSPYNIVALNNQLYVTYGKQDSAKHDSVSCPRCGFVNIFTTDGVLVKRLIPAGKNAQLNAPWGIAIAPASFWPGGAVLVGNFGDGRINAFDNAGKFLGALQNAATKKPIALPKLWAITFTGNHGPPHSDPHALYFSSGPNDETDGRFGSIAVSK